MALYIPRSIFYLARLLYVRPETFGSTLVPYQNVFIASLEGAVTRRIFDWILSPWKAADCQKVDGPSHVFFNIHGNSLRALKLKMFKSQSTVECKTCSSSGGLGEQLASCKLHIACRSWYYLVTKCLRRWYWLKTRFRKHNCFSK